MKGYFSETDSQELMSKKHLFKSQLIRKEACNRNLNLISSFGIILVGNKKSLVQLENKLYIYHFNGIEHLTKNLVQKNIRNDG